MSSFNINRLAGPRLHREEKGEDFSLLEDVQSCESLLNFTLFYLLPLIT